MRPESTTDLGVLLTGSLTALEADEGSFVCTVSSEEPWDEGPAVPKILVQTPVGRRMHRVDVGPEFVMTYTEGAVGAGIRRAAVDIASTRGSAGWFVAFTWSPSELQLFVGRADRAGDLLQGSSQPPKT